MGKNSNKAYLYIAPFVIVFLTFNIYPILLTFYFSLTSYSGAGGIDNAAFVGVENYLRLTQDKYFIESLINTLIIWGSGFFIQLAIAFGLALIFSDIQLKIKGVGFFRTLFYLPNIITVASVALLFNLVLDWNYGALNQMLLDTGIINQPINWLSDAVYSRGAVSAINTWMWFGQTFIILLAGISGISTDYLEAAMIDGANWWQRFYHITLPQLKPIMLYVMITSLIGGLQMFDLPLLLTDGMGAPRGALSTMVLYLYNQAFKYNNFGYASAIAYGLFMITVVFSIIIFRTMKTKPVKKGV
ncbi:MULTISPECIES: sugar ABC transporter permease [Carnobacterium]|uniref:Multiple sugar transport system permease protein n=1 Tax=Carnobacterium alterfunditum TaxID=28230 RepID=A0A1N6EXI9_9LACT|nr:MULTISPECIES: sugar ABC transporter permease [Carnobacterium]MBT2732425.1 sugar ABC transporter permease [Carnobacterium sp. ISL-102]SIN87748.1 multiple sugar transport system permease protein [Carnobacterium alterfunditum]